MLVAFHLAAFFLIELATPRWQKNVRDISREVVAAMREASEPLSSSATFFSDEVFFPLNPLFYIRERVPAILQTISEEA